jgi:hypothetical protein
MSESDPARLIVVDAVGLLCGGTTVLVAIALRGSLLRPSTWLSCEGGDAGHEHALWHAP